ncbi:MAG: hypothetical protein ACREBU_10355, partial [Nitrososphaera sp.]
IRQLLAAIAALTLLFSVISGANANYFAASSAFAEEGEEDEDQYTTNFGSNSNVHLEIDDEIEDESDTGSVEADLKIETQDHDLADGSYAVMFGCENAGVDLTLDGSLSVYEGEGDFEAELSLLNGTTYDDCVVGIGEGLSVALPVFTVNVGVEEEEEEKDRGHGANSGRDDEDDEDDDNEVDDDAKVRGHERERESSLEVEGDGVQFEVKVNGLNMSDDTYDVILSCDDPEINMTFVSALLVEEGEGMFKAEVTFVNGTYIGCELSAGDTLLASFDSFTVDQQYSDEEIEEKRKEKRRDIVSHLDAREEHKRRMNANPASTGDYEPGWNYTLAANGTAYQKVHEDEDAEDEAEGTTTNSSDTTTNSTDTNTNSTDTTTNSTDTSTNSTDVTPQVIDGAEAELDIDMAVWKSNKALILLNVLGGTVEVDGEIYNVEIGYALYSLHHDVMRIGAFVSDDSGNVYKLKLRGYAGGEDAEFPMSPGGSIDLEFEGKGGPGRNSLNSGWILELDGTLTAV